MQKNPYLILGVSEDATFAELQDAYTSLQNKYKADRFLEGEAGAEAIRKLEEVEWAYSECQKMLHEKATVNESNRVYDDVSKLIKEDKLIEAQSKLDSIDTRDAEWHYYQSIVYYKKKWLNDSKIQLEICVSMDPKNFKYAEALRKLNEDMAQSDPFTQTQNAGQQGQQQQNRGGYAEPQMDNTQRNADACCNTCCTLLCCDTCCECCGGDLISCC